jgi:hypothetical protein
MSLQQLWLDLTTDNIGFHTFQTRGMIPKTGGVYAWILPIKLNFSLTGDSLNKNVLKYKNIQAYDAKTEGHSSISKEYNFNWDPFKVAVKKNEQKNKIGKTHRSVWKQLSNESGKILKEAILLGSIFSRPLYIGYTNNLERRYDEHIDGYGKRSNFNKRFNNYLQKLSRQSRKDSENNKSFEDLSKEYNIDIRELLFVCIKSNNKNIKDEELMLIEEMLKTLSNPIFSKI